MLKKFPVRVVILEPNICPKPVIDRFTKIKLYSVEVYGRGTLRKWELSIFYTVLSLGDINKPPTHGVPSAVEIH